MTASATSFGPSQPKPQRRHQRRHQNQPHRLRAPAHRASRTSRRAPVLVRVQSARRLAGRLISTW